MVRRERGKNSLMTQENISRFFEADHDRLDGLFKNFQKNKRTNFPEARESFKNFKRGLERHIVWEEEILFPLFEAKTGITQGGPTAVMRLEHREIKETLGQIHEKVRGQNPETEAEEGRLLGVLEEHNHKEEHILYPMIDELASEEDRRRVFQKMESYPEEEVGCCS